MSYTRPDTGDSLNDYFTALADFVRRSPRLLEARDMPTFRACLDELAAIDRRSLRLFLRQHREEIPPEFMAYAQTRFPQEI